MCLEGTGLCRIHEDQTLAPFYVYNNNNKQQPQPQRQEDIKQIFLEMNK